jgi:hypothetical protein
VRDVQADILGGVEAQQERALLAAAWADAPLLAGEGDEELVAAVRAADAGKPLVQVATLEELADGLVEHRAPIAVCASVALGVGGAEVVEVFPDEAMKVGFQRLARAVDGCGAREEADHGRTFLPGRSASMHGNVS